MWIRLAFAGFAGVGFGILAGWLAFNDGNPPWTATHEEDAMPVAVSPESGQPPAGPTETQRSADLYADVDDFHSAWMDALVNPISI